MANRIDEYKPVEAIVDFKQPQRRRGFQVSDGSMRKVPALPYEIWCKPSGSVVHLVVKTTRDTSNPSPAELAKYDSFVHRDALRNSFFPMSWEVAKRWMPSADHNSTMYQSFLNCRNESDWDAVCEAERLVRVSGAAKRYESVVAHQAHSKAKLANKEAFGEVMQEFVAAVKAEATAPVEPAPKAKK